MTTLGVPKFLFHSLALAAVFVVIPVAHGAVLEEIIVTAQKRNQSLQDVPISAIAVTGEELNRQGLKELEDVTAALPNVTITEGALNDFLFIRGIGSGLNIGFEQSVGTFIDGIYHGRGLQSRNSFLDIERVEVLRGPQSIFFGNNTVAGALNIVTRGPTESWQGYGSLLYEPETESKNAEIALGGPVTTTLGIRAAFRFNNQDGWQTNSTINKKEPREQRRAGRITLDWAPTEAFNATVKFQLESNDTRGRALQAVGCPPPDGQAPAGYCLAYGLLGPAMVPDTPAPDFVFDDRRNGGGPGPFPANGDFNDLSNGAVTATLNWQVIGHTLTSVTGYSWYDDHRSQSGQLLAGPFPTPILPFANIEHVSEDYEQYSQELRIASPTGGRLDYIAGIYWQSGKLNVTNDFSAATFATRLSQHDQDDETIAGFASLTWHVNDALRLSAGARYTQVEKDVDREQILASNQGNLDLTKALAMSPLNPLYGTFVFGFGWQNGALSASRKDDDFTPSFNIQYDWNDDLMTYFSYAQGFKAGGFDEQNGRLNSADFAFRPESVEAFEIGLKSTLANGAMNLNITAFHSEFTDLQVATFDGVINFLVTNAGESTAKGVELEYLWQINDQFRFAAQLAYLDTRYDSRPNGQCTTTQAAGLAAGCDFSGTRPFQDQAGQRLLYSPEFSGNVSLTHVYTFADGFELLSDLRVMFEDDIHTSDDNDPFLDQSAYAKLDFSVTLKNPGDTWELSVVGKNLTDKQTSHQGNDLPLSSGTYFRFLDKPRTVAVQARYNWH
ncbi:MAG: TonB-dependent receptor [Gammaproteobacteria bacterium]|nr:TonB-dependent receptor [Gammaproteobacteria bacterium]MCY4338875.1 TonB-dependent receptor [Gammaproteobacteria bacterium]